MKINEIQRHEILKQAAEYCYNEKLRKIPDGYKLIGIKEENNGFHAVILKKDNDIIIAYRGTDFKNMSDLNDDFALLFRKFPEQAKSAINLYDEVHSKYLNCSITVTGHSLGGSLAQIVGAIRNAMTVTFNACGTKPLLPKSVVRIFSDNIINYCNPNDIITTWYAKSHIGTCYKIYSKDDKLDPHKIENMKPLETRVLTTPEGLKKKNYNEESDWEYYKRTGKHKPINMSSNCVGSYPVSGYTRSDGTKVGDYIRTCGAKHLGK